MAKKKIKKKRWKPLKKRKLPTIRPPEPPVPVGQMHLLVIEHSHRRGKNTFLSTNDPQNAIKVALLHLLKEDCLKTMDRRTVDIFVAAILSNQWQQALEVWDRHQEQSGHPRESVEIYSASVETVTNFELRLAALKSSYVKS